MCIRDRVSTQSTWATKTTVAQFANTAIVTLAVKAIFDANFWGTGGLIQGMTMIFLTNAIVTPLTAVIDVGYFIRLWTRQKLKKEGTQGKCFLTQAELHEVYEGVDFSIAFRYAGIMRTMFATAFYAPIIPLALVWSIIAMLCIYWADKYVLIRRCKRPDTLSSKLSVEMTELLEWILPLYALGNFFFNFRMLDVQDPKNFIILMIGLANAFLPMETINTMLFPPKPKPTQTNTYDQEKLSLEEDYDRVNPATKRKAVDEFNRLVESIDPSKKPTSSMP
eukprot:TRINITY_DN1173_c0_g1_i2.p1 TRINITY_DN1173_c0_g1~~TRINITY_DN1173_c0_g1_i2.p1  ORF type:complete len:279 (-),score=51.93 TRINITY_DN1173_c0_g1_i2:190-1026(-)